METFKGIVSNLKRDVEVVGPDYSGDSYTSGSTTDLTNFVLAGRSMQFKSNRATYDGIAEGDELIVAGKQGSKVFQVTAYKNLTKKLASYPPKRSPAFRIIAIAVLVLGMAISLLLLFIGSARMSVMFSFPFVAIGILLLYFDYKYSSAIQAIENYR
jgi:hypothetical protein